MRQVQCLIRGDRKGICWVTDFCWRWVLVIRYRRSVWLCVGFVRVSSEEAIHCRMNFEVISSSKETLGKAKQILVWHPGLFSKLVPHYSFHWPQKKPFCWCKLWSFFFLYSISLTMRRFSGLTENSVVFWCKLFYNNCQYFWFIIHIFHS